MEWKDIEKTQTDILTATILEGVNLKEHNKGGAEAVKTDDIRWREHRIH